MTTSINWQSPDIQSLLHSLPAQLSQMASDLLNYDRSREQAVKSLLSSLRSLAGATSAPAEMREHQHSAQAFAAWLYAQINEAHTRNDLQMTMSGLADAVHNRHGLRSFEVKVTFQWGETTLRCDIDFKHSDEYGVAEDSIMIELNDEQHATFLNADEDPFPEQPIDQAFLHWFHQMFKPGEPDFASPYLPERENVLDAFGLAIAYMQKQQ